MKLLLKLLAAALAMLALSAEAFAEGFASETETVTYAKTPYDKKYVAIDWNTPDDDSAGVPAVYGEYLLLPSINKVKKLSEKDGGTVGTAELNEKVSRTCKGAVSGNILIQPTRESLYAVDVGDMTVAGSRKFGEIVTDVAAKDGCCYFGYNNGEKNVFAAADFTGSFETVFEYPTESAVTAPALIGKFVVFGAGGRLVAYDGEKVTENEIGAEITNVFAGKYAVFMTCANGELRKVRLDGEGCIEDGNIEICEIGGELTAPAGIDNHIYVGSTEGFFVIDGLNMEITKKFTELKGASAPAVTVGNGVRAYTAAPHGSDGWYLYSILDTDETQTAGELAKIIDFTGGRTAVSHSGRMYFLDARGRVWAISETKTSVFMIVLKIVLIIGTIIIVMLILRAWAKNRQKKRPPEY